MASFELSLRLLGGYPGDILRQFTINSKLQNVIGSQKQKKQKRHFYVHLYSNAGEKKELSFRIRDSYMHMRDTCFQLTTLMSSYASIHVYCVIKVILLVILFCKVLILGHESRYRYTNTNDSANTSAAGSSSTS